jgi:hypothetical protein
MTDQTHSGKKTLCTESIMVLATDASGNESLGRVPLPDNGGGEADPLAWWITEKTKKTGLTPAIHRLAQTLADKSGSPTRIVRFKLIEVIEVVQPDVRTCPKCGWTGSNWRVRWEQPNAGEQRPPWPHKPSTGSVDAEMLRMGFGPPKAACPKCSTALPGKELDFA